MSDCLHGSCEHGQRDDVQNQRQQSDQDREELIDDLADCLAHLQDDSDIEKINRLLEEIKQLDPATPDFDAEQSLERFYQKYGSFFSAEPPAGKDKKPKRHRKPLRYIARTAAIIAALLILCIGAAQAAGFNIMSIFPWWNEERFHFAQEENDNAPKTRESNPEIEFESLPAVLEAYDIQVPLAPTQLPDGAELQRLVVENMEGQLTFRAEYVLPNGELFITIRQTSGTPFYEIEKNEDNAEIYLVNGIEHHLMNDEGRQKAIWYHGIWEGNIIGNVSQEELTAMIDSIYQ